MAPAELSSNFRTEDIIPKERGRRSRLAAVVLLISILLIFLFMFFLGAHTMGYKQCLEVVSLHMIAEGFLGLLKGGCDFFEEFSHVKTRYSGKYTKAIRACVEKMSCILLLVGFVLKSVGFFLKPIEEPRALPAFMHICILCLCNLLYSAAGLQTHTKVEISSILEKKHLNVAQGLAWSYYVGYLKIILPRFKKSVREFNEEKSNILGCEDTCKLYILIPLSCTLYDDLGFVDNNIEYSGNLPSVSTDRAGIIERNFKNSVYRIFDEARRPYYCIVEYATPLSSLYEMSNIASTAFSREDRIQQAKLFYRTLERILETDLDSEYRHLYRLIPYDDCQENDIEERNSHFLSKLILTHIQQQGSECPIEN